MLSLQLVLPPLCPTINPGAVWNGVMGSGVVESGTGASALHSAFISAKVSQRSQTRIKDDLSVLTSRFYIQELYELIFKVFLHISALSQLCTCALLSNFSYFIF